MGDIVCVDAAVEIRNVGRTVATNVSVQVRPVLFSGERDTGSDVRQAIEQAHNAHAFKLRIVAPSDEPSIKAVCQPTEIAITRGDKYLEGSLYIIAVVSYRTAGGGDGLSARAFGNHKHAFLSENGKSASAGKFDPADNICNRME